ncbi:MAG: universal stress protein [Gammaproteobacteria bacterium]|nr:universal stress protein [Gammaproteobacteria bacterium]
MTTTPKCILACIDGSELSNSVIDYAIWLAQNSQLNLKFVHTIEHSHTSEIAHKEGNLLPNMTENLLSELSDEERAKSKILIAEGKLILQAAMDKAVQAGLTNIIVKQRHGKLSEVLQDLKAEYALAVLGARGENHAGENQGLGSQLEAAIRAIHSPVFIVKGDFKTPTSLLFAYNGSPTSKKALDVLKQVSFLNNDLAIHVVAVQKTVEQGQALIDEALTLLAESHFTNVTGKALVGEIIEQLIQYQQQNKIDVTAMGAFSHGQLHGFFFGSFTTKMLLESKTNFLLSR